jgi:hypothetical protein
VPDSIKYTKTSDTKFKFCVTYKANSSNFDANQAVTDVVFGNYGKYSSFDDSQSNESSYLYIPTEHKKGENCQTIKPYLYGSNSSDLFDDSFMRSLNSSSSSSAVQGSAKDTERKTDIMTLQGHLEAAYAQNGFYPTLAQLNDATWRSTNMKGLDKEALRDPQGSGYQLSATASATSYSYKVSSESGASCDNVTTDCAKFTVTATLGDGTSYSKQNLF